MLLLINSIIRVKSMDRKNGLVNNDNQFTNLVDIEVEFFPLELVNERSKEWWVPLLRPT